MIIHANTKIAGILKERPDALEAIVSISPKFEKLRNPFLRKLMAGRTSIAMASKIGGCNTADFFNKLKPLGFEIDEYIPPQVIERKEWPDFMNNILKVEITELDVRPLIATGQDPLQIIIEKIKGIQPGNVLKIINSFYPQPLIILLEKKGFASYVEVVDDNLVEAFFYKNDISVLEEKEPAESDESWDNILERFKDGLKIIDVRLLEMPMPMMKILEALDNLRTETALFVYHKRIPVFLLPELADRKFSYRIREIGEGEVHLLIFKQ